MLFSFILAIIIGLVPQAIALYDKKSDRPLKQSPTPTHPHNHLP
ncbi:MAG: hypothetical protein P2A85_22350 [Microcoleus anatoxicus]